MKNKIICFLSVLVFILSSCSNVVEYKITTNTGDIITISASDYNCAPVTNSVICYQKGNGKPNPPDLAYYEVSQFETIRK